MTTDTERLTRKMASLCRMYNKLVRATQRLFDTVVLHAGDSQSRLARKTATNKKRKS